MKFKIEITETLQRTIEVEASSQEQALKHIREQYASGEIVLDSNDYVDTRFDPLERDIEPDLER